MRQPKKRKEMSEKELIKFYSDHGWSQEHSRVLATAFNKEKRTWKPDVAVRGKK
jgi:hypothetical protein